MTRATNSYDLTVLGGGLAGLSLALHVRQSAPQARIAVLEKKAHPVPEAAFKVGESTVEAGAYYFAKVLGLEQHIVEQQLPKLGLRFFFPAADNARIESRLEMGGSRYAPTPSYQLDRGRFENFLGQRCRQQGIEFLDQARVESVDVTSGRKPHTIVYRHRDQPQWLETRWLADASGRAAILKRQLRLEKPSPHKANATWFRVNQRIKIDDWSADPQWRGNFHGDTSRWYSTNHLLGNGYWVWLIPLASGSTSVGIVADERLHPLSTFNSLDKSLAWLDRHEPQCGERIRRHQGDIQDFLAIKHYATECQRVFSKDRWGIVGEAGFFLDPFYSPGSDFIAFGNTFLSDLIRRDLSGKGIRLRSFLYDMIFKKFFYGTSHCYHDQYPMFGHRQVMPVKIFWDYMVYWSLTAFIMLHDRLCHTMMYPWHLPKLGRLRQLNEFMQPFFRVWQSRVPDCEVSGLVDISSIPLVRETNSSLSEELDSREFSERFAHNVAQLETMFWEILDHSGLEVEVPFRRRTHTGVHRHALSPLFAATMPADQRQQATQPTPTDAVA